MNAPFDPPARRGWHEFRRGLSVQLNVIGALLMRELHTRYGRENIGYIWLILEPLTLASVIAARFLPSLRPSHGANHKAVNSAPI